MATQEQAEKLREWVEGGGTLISEGCPAYFGDLGRAGIRQPNYGLDKVFGALEATVEFMPDLTDRFSFDFNGSPVTGRGYRQSYITAGGRAIGWYEDGAAAVVGNVYGQGKTLLVGTFPSVGYYAAHDEGNLAFFNNVLDWAGVNPQVRLSDTRLQARLSQAEDGSLYLWIINPNREPRSAQVELSGSLGSWSAGRVLWGEAENVHEGSLLQCTVPERDALVLKLQRNQQK
jgi:beta-galactosidase